MKSVPYFFGILLVVSLVSCEGRRGAPRVDPAPTGQNDGTYQPAPQGPQHVSSSSFLYTGYEPLESWMEERFKVRYQNMPLTMIFDQKPISDIRYQFVTLPTNPPVFELVSPAISRREILQKIASFYNLRMQVQMVGGEPSYVTVTGNGGASYVPPGGVSPNTVAPNNYPPVVPPATTYQQPEQPGYSLGSQVPPGNAREL